MTDKEIDGRAIVVWMISDVNRANACQILFVSSAARKDLPFPQEFRTKGVLTVGEVEGFAAEGGVVNFRLESGKVRFEINNEAAEQKGLKISSKLLSLARIVKLKANPK